jgi:hypothetical protein
MLIRIVWTYARKELQLGGGEGGEREEEEDGKYQGTIY